MRLIRVPAGIGDNIWLFQKLINAKEKFDFHLSASQPQRGKQIFDLLPQLSSSCTYVAGLSFDSVRKASSQFMLGDWAGIQEKGFALEANTHLEAGRRIEELFPDLETSFTLDYNTSASVLPSDLNLLRIGIYASAYSTVRAWGFWNPREWFDLIQKLHAEKPEAVFYIIGASFDDLTGELPKLLRQNNIPCVDTVGRDLAYVIELLKTLDYFIGFPSGLSILNETLGQQTFMFYPPHLKKMMYAWADQNRINSHDYIAQLFCTPAEAFNRIATDAEIFDI